jgi:hypothetical protein
LEEATTTEVFRGGDDDDNGNVCVVTIMFW